MQTADKANTKAPKLVLQITVDAHHGHANIETIVGMNIPAQHVERRVQTADLAATLETYLGTQPPSGSVGVPLMEVFSNAEEEGRCPVSYKSEQTTREGLLLKRAKFSITRVSRGLFP